MTYLSSASQTGSTITFTWSFTGIGKASCTHDGVAVTPCNSPVTVQAKEISSASQRHTFNVVFEDVCGQTKRADFYYTQEGVVAETKVDPIVATATLPGGATSTTTKKNAAGKHGPIVIGLLAGALAAVAAFFN